MKVTILQPVECDGKPLKVGTTVDLKEAIAEGLVECGAAARPADAKALSKALSKAERDAEAAADAVALAVAAEAEAADAAKKAASDLLPGA